jgi:hypothetical protein
MSENQIIMKTHYKGDTRAPADKDDFEWRWYCLVFCLYLPLTIFIIFKKDILGYVILPLFQKSHF